MEWVTKLLGRELADGSWRECFDSGPAWSSRVSKEIPITVVVPVYDGGDAVQRMLQSVAATQGRAEVVVVDDHGSDPAVIDRCVSFAAEGANRRYVRNSRNLGFVKSVNRGISEARQGSDIIILNSDTVVPRGWIDRLVRASRARSDVATVTPLSNAAGIFSVPKPKVGNVLPEGWSVEMYARLLEMVAPAPYEVVPSGSGFCLYMARSALDDVGLLDERLFFRGYGEETDFCRRAKRRGWVNLVDMSTFVFHERGVSFGDEKDGLKKRNASLLKALDPRYLEDSRAWEDRTQLRLLWEAFSAAGPGDLGEVEASVSWDGAETVLKVSEGEEPAVGSLGSKTRVIGITRGKDDVTVDLFGRITRKVRMGDASIDDLLAYLSLRWGVTCP